jgi:hypothetical protein
VIEAAATPLGAGSGGGNKRRERVRGEWEGVAARDEDA